MAHATGKVLEEMVEILVMRHKSAAAGVQERYKQVIPRPDLLEAWLALTTVNCHRNI